MSDGSSGGTALACDHREYFDTASTLRSLAIQLDYVELELMATFEAGSHRAASVTGLTDDDEASNQDACQGLTTGPEAPTPDSKKADQRLRPGGGHPEAV